MSKKLIKDGHVIQKDYFGVFTFCSRISIRDVSQFNTEACKGKVSYLLKELEQLKHSWSTKNGAANKVAEKYKKWCQVLQSQRNMKKLNEL